MERFLKGLTLGIAVAFTIALGWLLANHHSTDRELFQMLWDKGVVDEEMASKELEILALYNGLMVDEIVEEVTQW